MKGDFSRNSFDPMKHFSRVLMQQGRVTLDADFNEQTAILLHYLRTLGRDLIGPYGGPEFENGFSIKPQEGNALNFAIGPGRYYVDGILCENQRQADGAYATYTQQPDYQGKELEKEGVYLVFLDVWERHLSHHQEEAIREVALGGADTATRTKVVWQVKATQDLPQNVEGRWNEANVYEIWKEAMAKGARPTDGGPWQQRSGGTLKARVQPYGDDQPCKISPESRYRGVENQLYRVEIHEMGSAGIARYKWSRDNGAVVFPVRNMADGFATLDSLGCDARTGLKVGDLVELVDDDQTLAGRAGNLYHIKSLNRARSAVELGALDDGEKPLHLGPHPMLRRWEGSGIIPSGNQWVTLEDGIQVLFQQSEAVQDAVNPDAGSFVGGDYWQIPARVATGAIDWPHNADGEEGPQAMPPRGVIHHYAPLALIFGGAELMDLRVFFPRLARPLEG